MFKGFRRSREASDPRVSISSRPGGVTVRIQPLVRTRGWRFRIGTASLAVGGAALLGSLRLVQAWETGLRKADFADLPLPVLVLLSLAILICVPLALMGIAALAFGEEQIDVGAEEIMIRTTAFERTRTRRIPRRELECWRETYRPLSPWWTWSVKRLAARSEGRLYPVAGAAGPKEKRKIGEALADATGAPLMGDWGRRIR